MLLVLLSWHATRLDVTSVCHIQSGFLHRRWRESVTEWGFPSVWGATLDTHHRPAVSHDALQCSVELLVRKNPSVLFFFLVKKMLSSSDTLPTSKHLYCGCGRLQASINFLFLSQWNRGPASFSSRDAGWSSSSDRISGWICEKFQLETKLIQLPYRVVGLRACLI